MVLRLGWQKFYLTGFAGVVICFMSGCAIPFPVYSVSGRNVATIRSMPNNIKIGHFTGDQKSVSCRLQAIAPEGDETFASYIRNAFEDEMIIAGITPSEEAWELTGTLKDVDVDCGIISGSWVIEMEMSVDDQPPFMVKTVHEFAGNYFGAVVYGRAYAAFVPAVQDFVNDVLTHSTIQAVATATK